MRNSYGGMHMENKHYDIYQPVESEEYMSRMQLDYFTDKLKNMRDQILADAEMKMNELRDASLRIPDDVDLAAHQKEITMEIRRIDRKTRQVKDIDRALQRIRYGEYGYCEMTGEKIGLKRLKAQPLATLCIEVQEMLERKVRAQAGFAAVY
jgi:DnaK suppressor protein